jgi:CRP/FNR family transcriptional regulator, cyclic AMP receptor protein
MWMLIAAWAASALVFAAFFMKTIVPLRLVAIASNLAFIAYALLGLAYGVFGRVYPILALHASLLPLNVVRLRQLNAIIKAVRASSQAETIEALTPFLTAESHQPGDVLFSRGDPADSLYLIEGGQVLLPEIGKRMTAGAVFGEVGVFAPLGRRSLSAICDTDCRVATLTRAKALELAYQDPRFALFLIRLISGYSVATS